jgi:hypothetical protein
MTLKPDYSKFAAYFNLDNGTGKVRGIYLQENAALKPIFEAWLEAVKDLGATRVTMRNTGGTDHIPFDSAGLPGFQFIQDPIEYMDGSFFGTHHTDMDTYDRLQREDLMQAAVVIATFAYQAGGSGVDPAVVRVTTRLATEGLEPRRAVILDVDEAVAARRMSRPLDRIERRGPEYRRRVREAFRHQLPFDPDRLVLVDANRTEDEVAEEVWRAFRDLL